MVFENGGGERGEEGSSMQPKVIKLRRVNQFSITITHKTVENKET